MPGGETLGLTAKLTYAYLLGGQIKRELQLGEVRGSPFSFPAYAKWGELHDRGDAEVYGSG